jgi:hypothetical protein
MTRLFEIKGDLPFSRGLSAQENFQELAMVQSPPRFFDCVVARFARDHFAQEDDFE